MGVIQSIKKGYLVGPNGFPLRAVVLECPYDSLSDNDQAQQLFTRLLVFKIKGYQAEYPYGILPLEKADFVANHVLLCEETDRGLIPHMAFKSITIERCQTHHLTFPIYHMIESAESKQDQELYTRVVNSILHQAITSNQMIAYNGSWTVSKELRAMKEIINFWDITKVLITKYYQTYNIPQIIAAASARFKVDIGKQTIGFDYLNSDGNKLDPIMVTSYNNEVAYIMHLKNFTGSILRLCDEENYKDLWEKRVVFSCTNNYLKNAA